MKVSSFLVAAFGIFPCIQAAALPAAEGVSLEERAIGKTPIPKIIDTVTAGINALDAEVVKVKSADLNQLLTVYTKANELGAIIADGQAKTQAAPKLDLVGSLAVQLSASKLVSAVQKLSKDLIAIKGYVAEAGVTAIVLQTLKDQKVASNKFAAVLKSKVPELLQPIADLSTKQINDALDKAIKAYSS